MGDKSPESVCLLPLPWSNLQTYGLEFWNGGQLNWEDINIMLVDQGHRSKGKVPRFKNVHWDIALTSRSLVRGSSEEGEE